MKKLVCSIFITFCILLMTGCTTRDGEKFKNEYEQFNDQYLSVTIDKNNNVKYSTYMETSKILNDGTGVIFLGYPESNAARLIVSNLLLANEEVDIDTIYYLNINNIDANGSEYNRLNDYLDLPAVLFVREGALVGIDYGNDEEPTEDQKNELLDKYIDYMHKVLNDICNSSC